MTDANTGKKAKLAIEGKVIELPIHEWITKERGLDMAQLLSPTVYVASADGYGNIGSCKSAVAFIDEE